MRSRKEQAQAETFAVTTAQNTGPVPFFIDTISGELDEKIEDQARGLSA